MTQVVRLSLDAVTGIGSYAARLARQDGMPDKWAKRGYLSNSTLSTKSL